MTATHFKTLKKHIFLHPVDKKRRHKAIVLELLKGKKKYSDKLGGALLNVKNIKVVGDRHLVVNGYTSMDVIADFQVFSPQKKQIMEGIINKKSRNHYGCLVLDTFNAALSINSESNLDPNIGDLCEFEVTETVVDGEILFMRGSLTRIVAAAPPKEDGTVEEQKDSAAQNGGNDKDESTTNFKQSLNSSGLSAASGSSSASNQPPTEELRQLMSSIKSEKQHAQHSDQNGDSQHPYPCNGKVKIEKTDRSMLEDTSLNTHVTFSKSPKKKKKRKSESADNLDTSSEAVERNGETTSPFLARIKKEKDDSTPISSSTSASGSGRKSLKTSPESAAFESGLRKIKVEKIENSHETPHKVSSSTEKKKKSKRKISEGEENAESERKRRKL